MTTNFIEVNGIKLYTNVGLWPLNDDGGVRLWSGTIQIDASKADLTTDGEHWYKVRCSCHKSHLLLFRCTHGTGKLKAGEIKYLSLKVPEPAISTAIMTVIIDNISTDLNLYKLDGAEELFFGTGEPEKLAVLKNAVKNENKWEAADDVHQKAFDVVPTLPKPIFENAPNGLTAYVVNSSTRTSTWQLLNQIVYPVVLELLQDLGDFAKVEAKKYRNYTSRSKWTSDGVKANDMTEMVLNRLSEKLREEYKGTNSLRNELTRYF
ncbi:hypothetical protein DICVIV_01733 [Dictyocaulus viviparus]|uniref:Uncharacterized protein n=1 Tax=Dictyocaulus viviparus TaxID=29172 RepID=A0A0D8Y750_DICVI|nr:hypothetical protein DICVIV_01733 [Dictyocaulus viviparus]